MIVLTEVKFKRILPSDYWMFVANLVVAVIVFTGVYLMNIKGIGKGSQPMFAIPFALMVAGMYLVCFLMFEEVKSKKVKWGILGCFACFSLTFLVSVLRM